MLRYILRRILLFIPTMIAISLVAFLISVNSPGDPVDRLLNTTEGDQANLSIKSVEKIKRAKRHELGLDRPLFYVSLGTLADIDTLHTIPDRNAHDMLRRLSRRTGNPEGTMRYYLSVRELALALENFRPDTTSLSELSSEAASALVTRSVYIVNNLLHESSEVGIRSRFDTLDMIYNTNAFFAPIAPSLVKVEKDYSQLTDDQHAWRTYIPTLHWYGLNNQYHAWISKVVKGDFGVSYRDQQPVMTRIGQKFWWSFSLTFLSVLLAYLVSIPIGVTAAYKRDKAFDRFTTFLLFVLYSMPTFFVGTMLLILFANPDFFNWLPEGGVQNPLVFDESWPFFRKLAHWAPYLILPLVTYTYSSFAFISRQVRTGVVEALQQDYIRTARAKGVPEKRILWKHAFRNALLPVITIFSNVLPAVIAGSVIIETIFSIPGMGLEIYESILNYDYPMIVAVFSIFGFLTLVGYLLSDILYAVADPRIKFTAR
jgi:peptide/nickel transport system permease protein